MKNPSPGGDHGTGFSCIIRDGDSVSQAHESFVTCDFCLHWFVAFGLILNLSELAWFKSGEPPNKMAILAYRKKIFIHRPPLSKRTHLNW